MDWLWVGATDVSTEEVAPIQRRPSLGSLVIQTIAVDLPSVLKEVMNRMLFTLAGGMAIVWKSLISVTEVRPSESVELMM